MCINRKKKFNLDEMKDADNSWLYQSGRQILHIYFFYDNYIKNYLIKKIKNKKCN